MSLMLTQAVSPFKILSKQLPWLLIALMEQTFTQRS